MTQGFSGADITEICQRAVKYAIRESIEKVGGYVSSLCLGERCASKRWAGLLNWLVWEHSDTAAHPLSSASPACPPVRLGAQDIERNRRKQENPDLMDEDDTDPGGRVVQQ